MSPIIEILFDRFNDRHTPCQHHIEDIAARLRAKTDAIAGLYTGTGAHVAHGSMELQQLLRGEGLDAFEKAALASSAATHFIFLGVGERQNAQRQNFIDFCAVKQVARTLLSNAW